MMLPVYICFFVGLMGYFFPMEGELVTPIGIFPGVLMLLFGKITDGGVGDGDAYIIMALGLFMGLRNTLNILLISSLISTVYCIFIIKKEGRDKKSSIPFAPFILSGYLGILIIV